MVEQRFEVAKNTEAEQMARAKLEAILAAMTNSLTRTCNLLGQIQVQMTQKSGAVQPPALTGPFIDAASVGLAMHHRHEPLID